MRISRRLLIFPVFLMAAMTALAGDGGWSISKGVNSSGLAVRGSYVAERSVDGIDFQVGCNAGIWAMSVRTPLAPTTYDRGRVRGEFLIDGVKFAVEPRGRSKVFVVGSAEVVRAAAAARKIGFRYQPVLDDDPTQVLFDTSDFRDAVRKLGSACGSQLR
ncbi:MAG TPA: hypothetical protein VG273_11985 [Bryobacteraceae bacterium]|nr:hypothetical protein [Bryobacteraceae bacterium]